MDFSNRKPIDVADDHNTNGPKSTVPCYPQKQRWHWTISPAESPLLLANARWAKLGGFNHGYHQHPTLTSITSTNANLTTTTSLNQTVKMDVSGTHQHTNDERKIVGHDVPGPTKPLPVARVFGTNNRFWYSAAWAQFPCDAPPFSFSLLAFSQ